MSSDSFTLVTGNRNKVLEAERILGRPLLHEALDLPEIQSLDLSEVVRAKGEEAWRRLQRPVVVEETGLALTAMGGFPGPLIKWMLKAMGSAGIAHMVNTLDDPGATAQCALLYFDGETSVEVVGETHGVITQEPQGKGFGFADIFAPDGGYETYAQLSPAKKDQVGHRGRAWRQFRQALADAGVGQIPSK